MDGVAAWHHHHWGHGGFGIGFVGGGDDGCYATRLVPTPFGYALSHRQRLRLLIQPQFRSRKPRSLVAAGVFRVLQRNVMCRAAKA